MANIITGLIYIYNWLIKKLSSQHSQNMSYSNSEPVAVTITNSS